MTSNRVLLDDDQELTHRGGGRLLRGQLGERKGRPHHGWVPHGMIIRVLIADDHESLRRH